MRLNPTGLQHRELVRTLRKVKQWAIDANACTRGKPALSKIEALFAWEPPPVSLAGLTKLRETHRAGNAWVAKYRRVMRISVEGQDPDSATHADVAVTVKQDATMTEAGGRADGGATASDDVANADGAAAATASPGVTEAGTGPGKLMVELSELEALQAEVR